MKNVKINASGEFNIFNNSVEYVSPLTHFKGMRTNKSKLTEEYRNFLDRFNVENLFCHISRFNEHGKYITFDYFIENRTAYSAIRYLNFSKQLELFSAVTDIAGFQHTQHVQVLWDIHNFVLSEESNKVKAILHDFGDFKVYDQTSALDGLKRLILLGLTSLNDISTMPDQYDFINQSDEVMGFAQEVMEADHIDAIRLSINSRLKQNSSLPAGRVHHMESHKHHTAAVKKKKEKTFFNSIIDYFLAKPFRISMLVLLALLLFLVPNLIGKYVGGKSQQIDQLNTELKQQTKINEIFTDYISNKTEKAKKEMATIDYSQLKDKKQKDIYIKWLIEDGHYAKAISLDQTYAYLIGRQINQDNKDEIAKVAKEQNNDVLKFFLAAAGNDYKKMTALADKVDLKRPFVVNKVVKSYILTHQYKELESFTKDIQHQYKTDSKEVQNLNKTKKYYQPYMTSLKEAQSRYDKKSAEVEGLKKKTANKNSKSTAKLLSKAQKELKKLKSQIEEQETKISKIKSVNIF